MVGLRIQALRDQQVDRLRPGARRDDVFIAREDAERLGLRDGDPVLLRSDYGEYRGRVRISRIRPGNLQVHWPEGNVLIPTGVCDPYCGEPDYNAICELIPLREPATVAEPARGAPAAP